MLWDFPTLEIEMRTVKHGVTFTGKSTVADVEGCTVMCRHLSAHPSLGKQGKGNETPKFDLTWTFDFSGCSQAEILVMAAEQAIIKQRRDFVKVSKPADVDWTDATFDAKELVTRRASPLDATFKKAESLSDEEKLALIAMLQG